jgi:hypothetical protein
MISAEPGWKALWAVDGEEVGRSRVLGWAGIAEADRTRLVGIIVDPNDPTRLVAADTTTDTSGGELMRYGFEVK